MHNYEIPILLTTYRQLGMISQYVALKIAFMIKNNNLFKRFCSFLAR